MEDMSGKMVEPRESKKVERAFEQFRKLGEDRASESIFPKLQEKYHELDRKEKESLFSLLNSKVELEKEELYPILEEILSSEGSSLSWPSQLQRLRAKVRSPRLKIFQSIARNSGGIRFLLDFREDLINSRKTTALDVAALDYDLTSFLEMLFQEGLLYLEEITLDSSYRQIEIIKNRDMVHPMTSLEEMGQRLGRDRRCFALYHRLLPLEPIVFIEVALTQGLVKNISEIVGPESKDVRKKDVDTAIFYSINNTQNGLAGLGLGKMLIVRVVDFLRSENDRIKTFATLSPMPGFWERYLRPILDGDDEPFLLKREDIPGFFSKKGRERILRTVGSSDDSADGFCKALKSLLSGTEWPTNPELAKQLKGPLVKIAYQYITQETNLKGKPLNPVAGFHLGNGALVDEKCVNFLANTSTKGLRDSCGIMVNYIYTQSRLTQIRRSFRWLERLEIRGFFR